MNDMTKDLFVKWMIALCECLTLQRAPKDITISGVFGLTLVDHMGRLVGECAVNKAYGFSFGGYSFSFIPSIYPNGLQYTGYHPLAARSICHDVRHRLKYNPESEEGEILEDFMLQLRGIGREVME